MLATVRFGKSSLHGSRLVFVNCTGGTPGLYTMRPASSVIVSGTGRWKMRRKSAMAATPPTVQAQSQNAMKSLAESGGPLNNMLIAEISPKAQPPSQNSMKAPMKYAAPLLSVGGIEIV
jgi:hypothetical protein